MSQNVSNKTQQSPLEKFQRLAQARYDDCKKKFKLLKNLAASAYEIDQNMAEEIIESLTKEIEELKERWNSTGKRRKRKADEKIEEIEETPSETNNEQSILSSMVD